MRCFVGFFGLDRAMDRTYPTIAANIFDVLADHGCSVFRAGHFNLPDVIDNPRGGEFGLPARRDGVERLELDLRRVERQAPEAILDALVLASAGGDAVGDPTGGALVNMLYQHHSLARLWRLAELAEADAPFDLYLLLRPDLAYLDVLPFAEVAEQIIERKVDLVTPSWHRWGGLNDRFAFCSRRGAWLYTARGEFVADFMRRFGALHPESLLAYSAARAGLSLGFTPMRAARVRADGERKAENFLV